jgi:hypothetical protein
MPTRVEDILRLARITLADVAAQRWDDGTLLSMLNEGVIDFCQQTQILRERLDVPVYVGRAEFPLPENCWLLSRVLYKNHALPIVTHRELDDTHPTSDYYTASWESDVGTIESIVYDKQGLGDCKVYPIPDKGDTLVAYSFEGSSSVDLYDIDLFGVTTYASFASITSLYGVVGSVGSVDTVTSLTPSYGVISTVLIDDLDSLVYSESGLGFGVTVGLDDYTFTSVYGVLSELSDPDILTETFSSVFGVVSQLEDEYIYVRCYYIKTPDVIDSVDSEISSPAMYDTALKFYVVGQAFLNDLDAASQSKAQQQLLIYERHVKNAKSSSEKDFTKAGQLHTTYRRGV